MTNKSKVSRTSMVLAVAALVLTAQPSWAEDAAAGRQGGRGGHGPGQMLQHLDKDGNGSVSKAEFMAGAEERFAKMDKNSDGVITKDELPTRREGGRRGGERGGERRGGGEDAPPADAAPPEAPPTE